MTDKERRILKHIQTMNMLVGVMEIEYMQDMVDYRAKDPNTNNHIRRIRESLDQIRKNMSFKFNVLDRELMEIDQTTQIHRVFTYFSSMDNIQLTEIMDAYEAFDIENPPIELPL